MDFSTDEIRQIVTDIYTAMLGLDVEYLFVPPATNGGRHLSGAITFTGGWEGALVVNLTESHARTVTAAMLGSDDVSDDEVRDVVGELANVAAGNVKALLETDASISLPTVTDGLHLSVTVPGSRVVAETAYRCGPDTFTVTMVERT